MARAIYAGDHQDVATCLSELARNLLHLKRLTEAGAAGARAWRWSFGYMGTTTTQRWMPGGRLPKCSGAGSPG